MHFKIFTLWKWIATFLALIWFLSSMCSPMSFLRITIMKSFKTMVTIIWFIASMDPKMPWKSSIIKECLITLKTLIWFLPTVCFCMPCKFTFCYESPITLVALVCFLSIVNMHMPCLGLHFMKMHCHNAYSDMVFPVCVYICILWELQSLKVLKHWLQWFWFISSMCPKIYHKITCLGKTYLQPLHCNGL